MSKTIATVTVVFQGNDPVDDYDVHERLREMIEEDAVPIEYTVEGEDFIDVGSVIERFGIKDE